MLKIATWNVNSIRIRIEHLAQLVKEENPDILCLQEVKAKEDDFPFAAIRSLGFPHIALYSIPGYNGVAILSKEPFRHEEKHRHVSRDDARHISVVVRNDIELHNIYIPAGGNIPDINTNPSFQHKLQFIDELSCFFEQRAETKKIICGDFNIAPLENDVWNHKAMLKIISHTPIEIEKLLSLYKRGKFHDIIRRIYPDSQKVYSWWSYRNPNWQTNNKGRRLDHIWCSRDIINLVENVTIRNDFRSLERPSDHVPVIATLNI